MFVVLVDDLVSEKVLHLMENISVLPVTPEKLSLEIEKTTMVSVNDFPMQIDKYVWLCNPMPYQIQASCLSLSEIPTIGSKESFNRFSFIVPAIFELRKICNYLGLPIADKKIKVFHEQVSEESYYLQYPRTGWVTKDEETPEGVKITSTHISGEVYKLKVIGNYISNPTLLDNLMIRMYVDYLHERYQLPMFTTTLIKTENSYYPISVIPTVELKSLTREELDKLIKLLGGF